MTTHCANPACRTPFRYFRSGKVFLIDFKSARAPLNPTRDMEYFWLCGNCSLKMRVSVNPEGNIILEQLAAANPPAKKIAVAAGAGTSTKKLLTA
jgi:hypothetical protein